MAKRQPAGMAAELSATPEDIKRYTEYAMTVFQDETPDLHDEQQTEQAIKAYFQKCAAMHIRPGNMGLYAALGITRQDWNNAVTGKSKAKISPSCIDIVKKAVRAMSAFRESLVLDNKLSPISYIFMGKNYDGLEDVTRLEVSPDTRQQADLTPEQIQKAIEQDIPVDVDGREI